MYGTEALPFGTLRPGRPNRNPTHDIGEDPRAVTGVPELTCLNSEAAEE